MRIFFGHIFSKGHIGEWPIKKFTRLVFMDEAAEIKLIDENDLVSGHFYIIKAPSVFEVRSLGEWLSIPLISEVEAVSLLNAIDDHQERFCEFRS